MGDATHVGPTHISPFPPYENQNKTQGSFRMIFMRARALLVLLLKKSTALTAFAYCKILQSRWLYLRNRRWEPR
jgi:hypothetical protein